MGLHLFAVTVQILLAVILAIFSPNLCNGAEFAIRTTWDNQTVDHPSSPVTFVLTRNDDKTFKVVIKAPFFDDPAPSGPSPPGEPFFGLWNHEVLKIFLKNDLNQYLEIELGPWGHHWVLLHKSYRNPIQMGLLIRYSTTRTNNKWQGEAVIPIDYLPSNVSKINAYAFHGTGDNRVAEALHPVAKDSIPHADDHTYETYQSFNVFEILDNQALIRAPITWKDALEGIRRFRITKTWNGKPLPNQEMVELKLKIDEKEKTMQLDIDAPFYKDPQPTSSNSTPFTELYKDEVVHLFLLSYPSFKYVEFEFGPWGHYLALFWNNYYNGVGTFDKGLIYSTVRSDSPARWTGTAIIPLSYLPPKVYLLNAHASHGAGSKRQHNSLYPSNSTSQSGPDYHRFDLYKFTDLSLLYPGNENETCSDIWQEMAKCDINSGVNTITAQQFLIILLSIYITLFH